MSMHLFKYFVSLYAMQGCQDLKFTARFATMLLGIITSNNTYNNYDNDYGNDNDNLSIQYILLSLESCK